MFEKSQVPAECPDEVVKIVNDVIDRLRSQLVERVKLPEPPFGFRAPNIARGYIQAHLRRILMFLEGGYAEYLAGRPLMTEMASRAIYENVATLCDFARKVIPLCEAGDYQAVRALTQNAAFATRAPDLLQTHGQNYSAPQILSQIDRMTKKIPSYRSAYDRLCELVHPNGLGAIVYFARFAEAEAELVFHPNGADKSASMNSLFMAAILLVTLELELNATEAALTKLGSIANIAKLLDDNFPDGIIPKE